MVGPQSLLADPADLFVEHRLDDTVGMRVDGRSAITTLLGALRHSSPGPTQDGCRIANPCLNSEVNMVVSLRDPRDMP